MEFQEVEGESIKFHIDKELAHLRHKIACALTVPLIESNDEFREGMSQQQEFFLRRIKLIRKKLEGLGIEFDRLNF